MADPVWHGVLDDHKFPAAHQLADLSKAGAWGAVLDLLETQHALTPNRWRPGGSSWYTPLHQAAWHGAPAEVVGRLVALGAFRSLRTATGLRARDIADERGHRHLLEVLQPPSHHSCDEETLPWLELHLANLVESRIRPQLPIRLRHPSLEVLLELPGGHLWYPVPGMYGGFSIRLREDHLYVESWVRVVGGSGRGHVITRDGAVLVRSGFV